MAIVKTVVPQSALHQTTAVASTKAAAMPSATIGLGSLVFDFEVEERTSNTRDVMPPPRSREALCYDKEKLRHFSSPDTTYAAKLLRDVRYFVNEERDPDAILLATKLSAVGYCVNVRTALGGGTSCFRNLRHEFLTVRGHGDFESVEFIIEPRFREHFSISHPTEEYSELLSYAPDVFVGVGARLVPIVQTLCDAMADSFERKGLTLPPWRRTQSMLSKWLPNRARDVSFGRASAPAHTFQLHPQHHGADRPTASASQGPGLGAPPGARISDPLWVRASGGNASMTLHQQQQQQQQRADAPSAAGQRSPAGPRGDDWSCIAFVPFGGAGGCSSDTEGPSPPAAAIVASRPTGQSSQCGVAGSGASAGAGAAAATTACPIARRAAQSSLLASRLQHPAQQGDGAMADAAAASACRQQQHRNAGVLPTRPPAYWGEAPIHRVRMGFQVATTQPPQPSAAASARRGLAEVPIQVQEQEQGQGQGELVPERPAAP